MFEDCGMGEVAVGSMKNLTYEGSLVLVLDCGRPSRQLFQLLHLILQKKVCSDVFWADRPLGSFFNASSLNPAKKVCSDVFALRFEESSFWEEFHAYL